LRAVRLRPTRSAKKRAALRDAIWPGAEEFKWPPAEEGGWARFPRPIALLLRVLAHYSRGVDLGNTYVELLGRTPEEGIVEITNEMEHAYLSGFGPTQRGARSWRERIRILERLGFIRVHGAGGREIDQVLMIHPRLAMQNLRAAGSLPPEFWNQFVKMHVDTTGEAPEDPLAAPQTAPAGDGGEEEGTETA
jgi:hypothetical protein